MTIFVTMKHFLAIDLGATSGRTVLGSYDGERVQMREWSRFANPQIPFNGSICWDMLHLYNEVLKALKRVADEHITLTAIGIDTWGCDFALFGGHGGLLGQPRCYRDPYTDGAIERFSKKMSREELYDKTGIQFMPFNSVFQFDTLRERGCAAFGAAKHALFIPDALTYMLTGKTVTEYTVASTSQMLNPRTGDLDDSVLQALGLQRAFFGPMVLPGTLVAPITQQIQDYTGLSAVPVIAVAGHDTASAVVSVPTATPNYAYLSCGTWSLLGIESDKPIINAASFDANFTNEGGLDGTTRFLKNICGLWLLENCRNELAGLPENINEVNALCEQSSFAGIINPDDASFAHPKSMTAAICAYLARTGQALPQSNADYMACIFNSLALRYRQVVEMLREMSPHPIDCLHVIGGGSLNKHMMQRAANALNMTVVCGPVEGTALGNILVQMRASGDVDTLAAMRDISRASVETTTYTPQEDWSARYDHFCRITASAQ